MSLVPDYGSSSETTSSDSGSDQEISCTEINKRLPSPTLKLPTPNFNGAEETKNSVFTNPFKQEENEKDAILQKHVKMVNTKDAVVINGKKICWNYRKGRCRFGHNCKFAHDSDVQKTQEQIEVEKEQIKKGGVVCQSGVTGFSQNTLSSSTISAEVIDKEDNSTSKTTKKKRQGLTQGLVPGKKVMKKYLSHKI